MAATPTVATIGAAEGNVRFPAERDASRTAVPATHAQGCLVDEL